MSFFRKQLVLAGALCGALFLQAQSFAPVKDAPAPLPPDSFAIAVATGNDLLLDLCLAEGVDVNGRDSEGRTALMVAMQQRDHALVRRLIEGGASVDIGDEAGMTPLMLAAREGEGELLGALLARSERPDAVDSLGHSAAHYAIAAGQHGALAALLPVTRDLQMPSADGRDLLALACDSGDLQMVTMVLTRANGELPWTPRTQGVLRTAIQSENAELTRLLLTKHAGPPLAEDTNMPLLAQAIVSEDLATVKALLAAGADPNVVLPTPVPKEFVQAVGSTYLRSYVGGDQGITPLMLAAVHKRTDILRLLLASGADRNRQTAKHKMLALYFAARSRNPDAVQVLLGRGPTRDELRVEISLAAQRATIFKNGVSILNTAVSTGRKGFDTPPGEYVVTDKKRSHRSSIYHVEMPFFMRLNCLDFGLHAGVVPNYPASHGCIRVPKAVAEKLFAEIPVGTLVTIN
jgi:ankyrin repeat protein